MEEIKKKESEVIGKSTTKTNSTSNTKNNRAKRKNRKENGKRAENFGENPHSKIENFITEVFFCIRNKLTQTKIPIIKGITTQEKRSIKQ